MRSYNIPPDASGDGPESDFINRTLKRFGELQFYDSQTVKVEQTTRGVRWHTKIPPIQPAAPAPTMFAITTLNGGDFFSAKTWDGMSFGTSEVLIAKPPRQRTSVVSELMDGVTVNYSAYTNDNNRTANDGTNSELEVCYPRYMTMTDLGFDGYITTPPSGAALKLFNVSQCIVFAEQPANGTGCLDSDGKPILWLEKTARVWARKTGQ